MVRSFMDASGMPLPQGFGLEKLLVLLAEVQTSKKLVDPSDSMLEHMELSAL